MSWKAKLQGRTKIFSKFGSERLGQFSLKSHLRALPNRNFRLLAEPDAAIEPVFILISAFFSEHQWHALERIADMRDGNIPRSNDIC